MALWKPFLGNRASLNDVEKHAGYVYWCADDGSLHFDYADLDGNLQRKQINAKEAEKLLGYDIATVLNSSDSEIPTSKAILDAIEAVKIDSANNAVAILSEAQTDASNKSAVVLAEAQKSIEAEKERAEDAEEALGNRIDALETSGPSTEFINDLLNNATFIDGLIDKLSINEAFISNIMMIMPAAEEASF